jgi:hypothetical protein
VSKPDVLEQMADAVAATMGYEWPYARKHGLSDYVVIRSALDWYARLVVE